MIDPNLLCMRCMGELTHENGVCPHCGFDNDSPSNEPHQLECRSILVGSYLVGCVLGQGGFGPSWIAGNRHGAAASRVLEQNQSLTATAAESMRRTPGNLIT